MQDVFAEYLVQHGWEVTDKADTASKARGVDLLAAKGSRRLGAEVKGWPSTSYSYPRRAAEVKAHSAVQPGEALVLAGTADGTYAARHEPARESLMVLPDYPRYRDLANRTWTGRQAAGVHIVMVREDGTTDSETWTP